MTTNTGTIQFGTPTGTDQTYEILTASLSSDLNITATGKLTLKAPENINIDGSINLYDGSQKYGTFTSDSNGDLTIQSGSGITENINLNASQHINIGLYTTTSTTTYCYLAQDTNLINGLNGVSINSYDSIDGTNNTNSNVTINAGSTGGNIYLNGNGTVNLLNGTTQYGTFTSNTLAGTGTTSDLSITSGNTSDNSGNIFLNALKKGAGDIAIGIGIGTIGNNLGIFIDDTGLLHLESKNGYKISTGSSVELQSTNSNVTIDASTNITLATGDDGIIFRGNNNGGTVGSFTYFASNFYINADNNLFLNTGPTTNGLTTSINLQNDGTTFGKFTGSSTSMTLYASGELTLNVTGNNGSEHINFALNGNTYCYLAEVTDVNGNQTGASINAYSTTSGYSNMSISTYGNGGNIYLDASGGSINLYDGPTQYGKFTGDDNNNLTIKPGSGNTVKIDGNITTTGSISSGGDISANTGSIGGSSIVTQNTLVNTLSNFTHPISASSLKIDNVPLYTNFTYVGITIGQHISIQPGTYLGCVYCTDLNPSSSNVSGATILFYNNNGICYGFGGSGNSVFFTNAGPGGNIGGGNILIMNRSGNSSGNTFNITFIVL